MAPAANSYPSHPRSKVNRYRNRAVYDYDFIHNVVDSASVVHVAFPPSLEADADPFPAVLPMIGCTGRYDKPQDDNDKALDVYLHGYVSSRVMRLATNAEDEANAGGDLPGLPVTISATLVDGIVLSLTPNSHSYNYRSAVVQGFGTPVTDEEEKLWAMELVTNSVIPERWSYSRVPPTNTEMTTTKILRVRVASASGKERNGGPNDEAFDMEDHAMREKVWTGVVPIWEATGIPVRADTEAKNQVPEYLADIVKTRNAQREEKAMAAMGNMRKNAESKQSSLLGRMLNLGGS